MCLPVPWFWKPEQYIVLHTLTSSPIFELLMSSDTKIYSFQNTLKYFLKNNLNNVLKVIK